jgi:hypothetical protein
MASAAANFAKKMQALRVEADEHQAKARSFRPESKPLNKKL